MGKTITFFDLSKRQYRILIDGGASTAADNIIGGAATMETEEDADTDIFMPVRTQTGYFRFIGTNDHSTWLSLIPSNSLSKRVVLQREAAGVWSTVWQGYITPQVYDNEYPGNGTVVHTMPIQCPLSVLDTLDIDSDTSVSKGPTMTFGELLQTYIFNRLTGTQISNYYIQGSRTVTESRLAVRVMWANFLDINSDGSISSKYTCKQVLEEFCKFFGYTCRINGISIFFTQPTENTATFTRFTALNGKGVEVPRSTFNITNEMFATNDNHEEIHPGIGNVTVRSDINKVDNLVEIPYDDLFDKYNVNESDSTIIVRALDQGDENVYALIRNPNTNGGTLTYDNESVSLSLYAAKFNGDRQTKNKFARFLVYDAQEVGDPTTQEIPESKKSFNWSRCVELFHGTEYTGGDTATMMSIASKQQFVIAGGILYISWKMRTTDVGQYKHMASDMPATLTAQLKVGDKYWNGTWDVANRRWTVNSAWTTTPTTFTMYLDNEGPRTTRRLATEPQYDGCGVPVNATLRGIIEFKVIDVQWWQGRWATPVGWERVDNNGFVPMHDFKIGFVRGTIEEKKRNGNEFTQKGGAFRDEVNVDLLWASDMPYGEGGTRRMPAGVAYILDSTDIPKEKVASMANTLVIPEQELARIIAAYGNRTHRVVQVSLRGNSVGAVSPLMISAGLETGMFPLAVSHDWREDITTITMISI